MIKVTDRRGKDEHSDDDIISIIKLACMQTHRAIPTASLTSEGFKKATLKRLEREGRLKTIGLMDQNGTVQTCYYPADFEAYKVSPENVKRGKPDVAEFVPDGEPEHLVIDSDE